jgi:hypothetical protein
MTESSPEAIAALLDRLAAKMRENGDAILAESERIKGRIDDNWHSSPSEAASDALATAAVRLSMSEKELSLLVRVIWNARG